MKLLLINSVCGIRSTGRICTDIAREYENNGYDVKIAYGREKVPEKYSKYAVRIGSNFDNNLSAIHTRITDKHGFANKRATKVFLKWCDEYDPDILWLHNLHGYYINVEMLFEWIKSRPNMQVRWTLHDCWAFTGHCTYFTAAKCDKWKTKCQKCPQMSEYPTSNVFDSSLSNYNRKKAAFTGVKNMTLITPSKWLTVLVKNSFLGDYPIEIKKNSINTDVFKPTSGDFRERYGLADKKIILGVATFWSNRKGLGDFLSLSKLIDKDWVIVLVGLNEKQIKTLPNNIVGIKRTNNTRELAEIYTAADVFVNASVEETFGLTTVEALSCETPVIVYKSTACEEVVRDCVDHTSERARIVDLGDVDAVYNVIRSDFCFETKAFKIVE